MKLEIHEPRRVLPIVAPSTTPPGVVLTSALDFGSARTTVARSPGSVRRTSHLDALMPGDDHGGLVTIGGAARDLYTGAGGAVDVLGEATVAAELDHDRTFRSLVVTPPVDTSALLGQPVGRGFRAALDRAVPGERAARSPLYLLLDDLPVIMVITGYVSLFAEGGTSNPGVEHQRDVCSGFRHGGVMMGAFDDVGALPISIGPVGRRLEPEDDPWAWHAIGEQQPGSMRRRRLVEVRRDHGWSFYAYFRDTYRASLDEPEIVMHEYQIHGALSDDAGSVVSCLAEPLTLPWPECPHAAASARWIEGQPIAAIRDVVRTQYRGTDTCTHLNDLIRSLGDLDALAASRQFP